MYHDLKLICWCKRLKRDIAELVAKCQNFQQVKSKHIKPSGLLKEIQIPTWKFEDINMEVVVGVPRIQKSYDSIW